MKTNPRLLFFMPYNLKSLIRELTCKECGKVEDFIKFGHVVIKKGNEADGAYYDLCPECLEKVMNAVLELKDDASNQGEFIL